VFTVQALIQDLHDLPTDYYDVEIVVESPDGRGLFTIDAVAWDPITGLAVLQTLPRVI
jgi:hypothetical protein